MLAQDQGGGEMEHETTRTPRESGRACAGAADPAERAADDRARAERDRGLLRAAAGGPRCYRRAGRCLAPGTGFSTRGPRWQALQSSRVSLNILSSNYGEGREPNPQFLECPANTELEGEARRHDCSGVAGRRGPEEGSAYPATTLFVLTFFKNRVLGVFLI